MDRERFRFYTSEVEAVIRDNGNMISISDYRFDRWSYRDGDPDDSSCSIYVKAGNFSGLGVLRFSLRSFRSFIEELRKMDELSLTNAWLDDATDLGARIDFDADTRGNMMIDGYFTDAGNNFGLRFKIDTDMSVIRPFCQQLEQMIKDLKL